MSILTEQHECIGFQMWQQIIYNMQARNLNSSKDFRFLDQNVR